MRVHLFGYYFNDILARVSLKFGYSGEGHKILQNLLLTFDYSSYSQK